MKKNKSTHHGYKTLLEAIKAAQTSTVEAKKYLQDKRLTSVEKKLVTSLILMRANDFSFIDDLLQDQSFEQVPFLKGLKHLFLGWAYVYRANSVQAEEHLALAMPYLRECESEQFVERMVFKFHINFFYAYTNQKRLPEMKFHFDQMVAIKKHPDDLATFEIMKICYYSMSGQYALAEEALDEVRSIKSTLNDIQIMSYYIESFDLCMKLDLFEKGESVLTEMKKHRTFRLSACFKYMDKLLKFLMKGERIYVYERDFQDHEDLSLMINVIRALDESHEFEAQSFWNRLAQLSPDVYKENFHYVGDKCLFSHCLNKCLSKSLEAQFELKEIYTEQEKVFIDCFLNGKNSQLRKEELYHAIYGKEMEFKDDLVALASIVYRINKKGELLFKSKKGAFVLVLDQKKSA